MAVQLHLQRLVVYDRELWQEMSAIKVVDETKKRFLSCFQYSQALDKCLVGWSDGAIDVYHVSGHLYRNLRKKNALRIDSLMSLELDHDKLVLAADMDGGVDIWALTEFETTHLVSLTAHDERYFQRGIRIVLTRALVFRR